MLASRPVSAIATRLFGTGIPIFMLHRMIHQHESGSGHTPLHLRRCLQYLKDNGHSFVSLEDILAFLRDETALPSKPVAFTMDDGFYDQATLAAPVFIEFNCPVTIFLISGMIDGNLWPWFSKVEFLVTHASANVIELETPKGAMAFQLNNRQDKCQAIKSIKEIMATLSGESVPGILDKLADSTRIEIPTTPPDEYRPLTWDMARGLEKQGIKFGPHSVSHRILSRLNDSESQNEITGCWQRLENEMSSPSRVFCYPTGRRSDFGSREIEFIKKNGFLGAVSAVPAYVETNPSSRNLWYSLPRFALPESFNDFIQYCSWIEYAKEKRRNF